ncbi:MAG TPA: peptidoglycan-binding domain-containing protein [Acidimicrobiales bacterium]|nr:peptidoglycan-binding domain-containing protein [Acidimicrobiales bacterium]
MTRTSLTRARLAVAGAPRPTTVELVGGPAVDLGSLARANRALAAAGIVLVSATVSTLGLVALFEVTGSPAAILERVEVAEALELDVPVAVLPPAGQDHDHDHDDDEGAPPAPPEGLRPSKDVEHRLYRVAAPTRSAPATSEAAAPLPGELVDGLGLSRVSRTAQVVAAPGVVVPSDTGALPLGKGMWLYLPEEVEGGNVDALVARATSVGLTHVYVRTGSSRQGFYAQGYMDELLPKAHAAGIRVYGWDFPYLDDVGADVDRALAAIAYTTPSGDRIDGFAADIETPAEGTNLTADGAGAYGERLRAAVGPTYPLVAVVPRPSPKRQAGYPYHTVIPPYDAVAPMTYWLNRQPDSDVTNDVAYLAQFGKPVIPIGQAYDGAPEGGRPGPPPPEEIQRFLGAAQQVGAAGASFWSWQHASEAIWEAIAAAPEFRWEAKPPAELRSDQIRALQAQLTKLGHPVSASGTWDDLTAEALRAYQSRARLPQSGILDGETLSVLLAPFNPALPLG